MRKILVLGSEGQIGQYLVRTLTNKGKSVERFDLALGEQYDLRSSSCLDEAVKESDFVFFLAFDVGGSHYLQSFQQTYGFLQNNIELMSKVFESLKHHKTRFVFASSQMSTMSFSPYGALKNVGEFYTSSLGGLSVRFWNVYGYETDPKKFHVISDFLHDAIRFRKINMRTSGKEERDFLHGTDCANALVAVMEKFQTLQPKNTIDIASFKWTSIFDIASIIAKLTGAEISQSEREDVIQKGQQNQPKTDILDYWKPQISIEEGISQVYREILSNKHAN